MTPQEKLANALQALHELQRQGVVAIRSPQHLSRTDRERLVKSGFLHEVIRGWYITARPDEPAGDSTSWYASFWDFCAAYLSARFGAGWCLSPEQSLLLHGGNRAVPAQLIVRARKGGNKPTALPHGTSLFEVRSALPAAGEIVEREGLRLYSVPAALGLGSLNASAEYCRLSDVSRYSRRKNSSPNTLAMFPRLSSSMIRMSPADVANDRSAKCSWRPESDPLVHKGGSHHGPSTRSKYVPGVASKTVVASARNALKRSWLVALMRAGGVGCGQRHGHEDHGILPDDAFAPGP